MAITMSSSVNAATLSSHGGEPSLTEAPHRMSRFLLGQSSARNPAAMMQGRGLWGTINLCGQGSGPNYQCKEWFPLFKQASCCTVGITQACWDTGAFLDDKCGSCTTKCAFGKNCCSGQCVNKLTDPNNCGFCGNKCKNNLPCQKGLCGYGWNGKNF
jgi:hypothetical protein